MELLINKSELLKMLQVAVNISSQNTSEPIINNSLLEARDNCLYIKATNYDNSFQAETEAQVRQPGQICLNTAKLFNLTREFRGQDVLIKSTPQNWTYLSCGNSKVKLPGISHDSFPPVQFEKTEKTFPIPGADLQKAIELTFFAIGENEARKNLMGLNMEIISPDTIQWTGGDGFRVSRIQTKLSEPVEAEANIIIPKRSLTEIRRIIEYYGEEETTVSFDDNIFQISTPKAKFRTKLIEADFPNLKSVADSSAPRSAYIPKSEIINGVRLISAVTENYDKAVMKLILKKGLAILESQKLEFGEGDTEISAQYSDKEITIGLNVKFFLEALRVFENSSDEMIAINVNDHESPLSAQCDEWPTYKTVLLPVKIKW